MSSVWTRLEPHLAGLKSPSQYIGGEWNCVRRDWQACPTRFLMAFPDAYTIGMSHLGMQILYSMLNEIPGVLCERAFNPWPDLEAVMRREGIPLFSIDSHRPAREFDVVGVSLQSEMGYSNILVLLDLAQIPLHSADRGERDPIVIGGGPNASFPEPLADFFDILILGDGEETTIAFVELYRRMKAEGARRGDILREAAHTVPGAYVPSLYRFEFDGRDIRSITPLQGAPARVAKANVPDLSSAYYPMKPIVPHSEVVFDRINLEIMRGCPHRCRFCHAVSFKNKLRFRRADLLIDWSEKLYAATGHDEISLISLSSGDHPEIRDLMIRLNERFAARRVTIALPSLRIDGKLKELPRLMKSGRRSGFTVAPEAGTEAYRQIIRKPILDADLFDTARAAFEEGFTHLKLYFMIGMPRETDEDIEGIVRTARECARLGRDIRRRHTEINVTI
ncbi:MAG TPA: TIGR03960 family B12-binding radical SAM protein, partial [Planctomycetota bacterium]|nr:TIGR03960 family B12-binding radical SAM protein [Planctomycetota bacterium]